MKIDEFYVISFRFGKSSNDIQMQMEIIVECQKGCAYKPARPSHCKPELDNHIPHHNNPNHKHNPIS